MQMLPNSSSSSLIDLWSRDQASDGVVRIQLIVSLVKMAACFEIFLSKCAKFRGEGQFIYVQVPLRYNIAKTQWQNISKLSKNA